MRRFAAPFVIVTACGGRTPPVDQAFAHASESWIVERDQDSCWATESEGNPPPVYDVRCVYGDDEFIDVSQIDGACWATEPKREVPCPPDVAIPAPPSAPEPKEHPPWLDDGPI